MRCNTEQIIANLGGPVGVEHHGQAVLSCRGADRPHELGKAIVGQYRIDPDQ
jgi:hypothetical protein